MPLEDLIPKILIYMVFPFLTTIGIIAYLMREKKQK